jgi:hypothetical protein
MDELCEGAAGQSRFLRFRDGYAIISTGKTNPSDSPMGQMKWKMLNALFVSKLNPSRFDHQPNFDMRKAAYVKAR